MYQPNLFIIKNLLSDKENSLINNSFKKIELLNELTKEINFFGFLFGESKINKPILVKTQNLKANFLKPNFELNLFIYPNFIASSKLGNKLILLV